MQGSSAPTRINCLRLGALLLSDDETSVEDETFSFRELSIATVLCLLRPTRGYPCKRLSDSGELWLTYASKISKSRRVMRSDKSTFYWPFLVCIRGFSISFSVWTFALSLAPDEKSWPQSSKKGLKHRPKTHFFSFLRKWFITQLNLLALFTAKLI